MLAEAAYQARVRPAAELGRSTVAVAAVVLLVHALWIGVYFAAGHEIRDFIKIGSKDVQRSHASQVIRYDPTYRYPPNHDAPNGSGFDGQLYYYIALDPPNARYYIDTNEVGLRYERIVYPITARVLALGQPSLVPYALLLINLAAIALGTLAVAAWLRRKGVSPWFAAIYGFYPGLLISLQRDLTEPLAYALVAAGIYLFSYGGQRRLIWAGLAFGLAALTRETTILFPLVYALWLFPNWRRSGLLAGLSLLPLAAYEGFLWKWLGSIGTPSGPSIIPFQGLFANDWSLVRQGPEIIGIILPALICLGLAIVALAKGLWRVEVVALFANIAGVVLFLPNSAWDAYTTSGRVSAGVVLAAINCIPLLPRLRLSTLGLAWLPAAAAASWMIMFPAALAYGFMTAFRM
jgi:hypothetical protein